VHWDFIMPIKKITVAEIAERAGRKGDNAFIQRVRHWTRERLLLPHGEANPGIGKYRLYSVATVLEALLLDKLTNKGMPIAEQREIITNYRKERDIGDRVREHAKTGRGFWLVVATWGNKSFPHWTADPKAIFDQAPDDVFAIDLIKQFNSAHTGFNPITDRFDDLEEENG
jgi:DNA-binding transcriptional MerR regulator